MNATEAQMARNTVLVRNAAISADDPTQRQFVGMIIEYVGSSASCLITTAANNTIASAVGAAGSEAADANFTVGAVSGTIDLTAAAADTMGEVVDFINGLADYKARLVGLRRADDADTVGALVAVTSQQAKVSGGLKLAVDTSVADHVSFEISALDGTIVPGAAAGNTGLGSDWNRHAENSLRRVDGTFTYSGADLFRIYEVDDENKSDELLFQTTISAVLAASTNAGSEEFPSPGITARRGRRLLVRLSAATSIAVTNCSFLGTTTVFA